ncbi:hypothetical protein [Algoriphagus boritolerans]|uniref:hypothetical protein n=1 Tax=Algoriphagus boritolerans TaxID=308111 RepID=UPI002FCE4D61
MCILPMEGWDGTTDGRPTELTKRRWQNFALSGAKLLWGCEAVAVRPEGRANPNQLMLNEHTIQDFCRAFSAFADYASGAFWRYIGFADRASTDAFRTLLQT